MRAEVDGQIEQHTEDFIDDLTSKLSKTNLNEKDMKSYKDSKVKFIVRGEHKDMQFVELKTVMKYRYDNGDLRYVGKKMPFGAESDPCGNFYPRIREEILLLWNSAF